MVTLEEAISTVNQLSIEQREMLLEIVKNQMIEARREEIAQDAKEAIAAFHRGELKPQPIEEIISELQATLVRELVLTPKFKRSFRKFIKRNSLLGFMS